MTTPSIDGLRIIDCDTHLSEPHDLWTRHAPAGWRDRLPQVKQTDDGKRAWFVEDVNIGPAMPLSVIDRTGRKIAGTAFNRFQIEEVFEASYDVKARVAMMDRHGIFAQIVYPNVAGFGSLKFLTIPDPELRAVCVQVYNDAVAELQADSGGRLFPMGMVPWWDVPRAVKEAERLRGLGLRGIVMCPDPDAAGFKDLSQPEWYPFFEAMNDLELPINFHVASSEVSLSFFPRSAWPTMGPERLLALGSAQMYVDNARVLGNLLYSDILVRFPRLRFVSVESGIGWIPFYLEALDYQLTETVPNDGAHLAMKPSDYFRRSVYSCFWFERAAPQRLIEEIGVRNVLFETDFPHPTCLYPDPVGRVAEVLRDVDPQVRRRILQDNAAELYRIPLAAA